MPSREPGQLFWQDAVNHGLRVGEPRQVLELVTGIVPWRRWMFSRAVVFIVRS